MSWSFDAMVVITTSKLSKYWSFCMRLRMKKYKLTKSAKRFTCTIPWQRHRLTVKHLWRRYVPQEWNVLDKGTHRQESYEWQSQQDWLCRIAEQGSKQPQDRSTSKLLLPKGQISPLYLGCLRVTIANLAELACLQWNFKLSTQRFRRSHVDQQRDFPFPNKYFSCY